MLEANSIAALDALASVANLVGSLGILDYPHSVLVVSFVLLLRRYHLLPRAASIVAIEGA